MYKLGYSLMLAALTCGCTAGPQQKQGQDAPLLRQVQTIELPGVEGRFDHFAVNVKGNRLYVAALGNNTMEVIDTAAGKRAGTIAGLRKPTGVAFMPESGQVAVAGGDDGTLRFYDGATLKPGPKLEGLDDADNVRYDAAAKRLYVGYGSGSLAVVDAEKATQVADIKLDAHPESFQLEKDGKRIFVNVPEAGHIAVVDREKQAVVAKWPVTKGKANFPMSLDEAQHRLFVGCRQPAKLLVIDTEAGKTVTDLACAGDTDDLFHDAARKRIYVSGGDGVISVIDQRSADEYRLSASIKSAPGARTSFFVPDTGTFYLAVPHRGEQRSEIRVFRAERER
jgi:YVTN family beta-propeller protein